MYIPLELSVLPKKKRSVNENVNDCCLNLRINAL